MTTYSVQFRYNHRKFGPEGRTLRVTASSLRVGIGKATRTFLGSLSRKERFDANKQLSVVATFVPEVKNED